MKTLFLTSFFSISFFLACCQQQYDYLSIGQRGQWVTITINDSEVRSEKYEQKISKFFDFRPALKWIRFYEEKNWEVVTVSTGTETQDFMIAVMRKKRN